MAGITFTVELDEAAVAAKLAEIVDRMERPSGFYKGVGEYLTEVAIPRNFATETSPDGVSWASLRPLTVARREAKGQTPIQILRASGAMAASINYAAGDDHVRIGSPAIQAAVMQFGAKQGAFGRDARNHPLPWGDIPARPFLGISADDEVEIIRIAEDWLGVE
jgi:phage virion morphogenesis protein